MVSNGFDLLLYFYSFSSFSTNGSTDICILTPNWQRERIFLPTNLTPCFLPRVSFCSPLMSSLNKINYWNPSIPLQQPHWFLAPQRTYATYSVILLLLVTLTYIFVLFVVCSKLTTSRVHPGILVIFIRNSIPGLRIPIFDHLLLQWFNFFKNCQNPSIY